MTQTCWAALAQNLPKYLWDRAVVNNFLHEKKCSEENTTWKKIKAETWYMRLGFYEKKCWLLCFNIEEETANDITGFIQSSKCLSLVSKMVKDSVWVVISSLRKDYEVMMISHCQIQNCLSLLNLRIGETDLTDLYLLSILQNLVL